MHSTDRQPTAGSVFYIARMDAPENSGWACGSQPLCFCAINFLSTGLICTAARLLASSKPFALLYYFFTNSQRDRDGAYTFCFPRKYGFCAQRLLAAREKRCGSEDAQWACLCHQEQQRTEKGQAGAWAWQCGIL